MLNEKVIKGVIADILNEIKYYHGTPSKSAAESIMKNGLGNGTLVVNGGAGDGFESAQGRQYITKSSGNASRYATMMNDGDEDGYVLEFDVDENNENVGVDEDEVGHIIYSYLHGKCQLPFRRALLGCLSQEELNAVKQGSFKGFAACKKIIDNLSREEIVRIIQSSHNATISSNIKPTNCYSLRRPSQDEKKELFKAKDFQPFEAYFNRNRRSYTR